MSDAHEPPAPVTRTPAPGSNAVLHVSQRDLLRPLRDQILRLSGCQVTSAATYAQALELFHAQPFDLVLIDVETQEAIHDAERFCSEVKTVHHGQNVAFICNFRVAVLTDCPDEVLRADFDPAAFVAGVHAALRSTK